jgi:Pyruvate/2-oxoacid:ferredoxin oxidoreductase delta subunit
MNKKPIVIKHKCIMCCECTLVCPVEAINISQSSGKAYIQYKKCIGCGACVKACPVKALKV